jgi:phage-related protein
MFPAAVREEIGYALYLAQVGAKHPRAKPLKGFGGGTLEVLSDHRGDTYRAVYTVRLRGRVYVLHAFMKKSKKGIATPKPDIAVIRQRLGRAMELHAAMEK